MRTVLPRKAKGTTSTNPSLRDPDRTCAPLSSAAAPMPACPPPAPFAYAPTPAPVPEPQPELAAFPAFPTLPMPMPFFGTMPLPVETDRVLVSAEAYQNMRMAENVHRVFDPRAKYIRYRRLLVDWMFEAGEHYRLSNVTCHVAVGYMDRVLQTVAVARNRLQLVACCCFIIAAKYEEAEERVPCSAAVSDFVNKAYPPEVINQTEVLILEKLGWACTVVTPLHFLGHFAVRGVLFDNDSMNGRPLVSKVPRYMAKYTDFFSDMCAQEYSFHRYSPSLLAAAIVLASRRALNISPAWNPALHSVLTYDPDTVVLCFEHVWQCYALKYPDQVADLEAAALPLLAPAPAEEHYCETPCPAAPQRLTHCGSDDMMMSPALPSASANCSDVPLTPVPEPSPDGVTKV